MSVEIHTEFFIEERCFLLLVLIFFYFFFSLTVFIERSVLSSFVITFPFVIGSLYLKHIQVLCCYHEMIHVTIITFQEQLRSLFFKCRYAVVYLFLRSPSLHDAVLN